MQTLSAKSSGFSEGAQKGLECISQSFPKDEITSVLMGQGKGFRMLFKSPS